MTNLQSLESQLSKSLGKKYRYLNLVAEVDNPTDDQKTEIAERVLREQDLGVFGAQAEYTKWQKNASSSSTE